MTKSVCAAESADLGLRPRIEQIESEDISRDSCNIGIITNNEPTPQLLDNLPSLQLRYSGDT